MATMATTIVAERFRAIVGATNVLDGALERTLYGRDGSIASGDCGLVVLPERTEEVASCLRLAAELELDVVPRGSGTGLTGGAIPLGGAVVLSLARMRRILEIDPETPCAWVEPGVLNLDISTAVRHLGLYYAPDPSSQAACSIGGNVATNSGGPHCLASGVTVEHIIAIEWVLPSGEVVMLGGLAPDAAGLDLRGLAVGSEGTLGVATKICVRLMKNAPAIETLLLDFADAADAGACCGAVIAGGVIPAAMEMMDQKMIQAVEAFVHADLPVNAGALLLIEVDGTPNQVSAERALVEKVARAHRVTTVRVASSPAERDLFWKARKSAFGAVARIAPSYYLHDCVVPRTRLVEVLARIREIASAHDLIIMNVFHAGDGNLHPLIAFDRRDPEQVERVHAAGKDIIEVCVAVGGVLTGEHGVGLEKRDYMPLTFTEADLDQQARVRCVFDRSGRMNPAKVLPIGSRCGELILDAGSLPEGTWL